VIPTEVFQILIIIGNVFGWLGIYYLVDRKVDKKVMKYWRKVKESEEGQDLFTILREVKRWIKSGETQKLFKEGEELISEFRALLKTIKERTQPSEESEEDTPVLPRLE